CPASESQSHLDPALRADPATGAPPSHTPLDVFHRLLSNAVASLEHDSPEARRAVYATARKALAEQLQAANPGRAKPDVSREGVALEEAILRLELELRGTPVPGTAGTAPSSANEQHTVEDERRADTEGSAWDELEQLARGGHGAAAEPRAI